MTSREGAARGFRRAWTALIQLAHLPRLPPRVIGFYLRAVVLALRLGDRDSLRVVCRPRELSALLRAARGRRRVVEHGTATGWSAIALALSDPARRVASYDPAEIRHRDRYLALVPESVLARIELVPRPGEQPLEDHAGTELLFLDGPHKRSELVHDFTVWRKLLAPEALVAFHDFHDPAWPGVAEAVRELRLAGHAVGHLFVARVS
jgi:predicted O-methyltransferase YrrM